MNMFYQFIIDHMNKLTYRIIKTMCKIKDRWSDDHVKSYRKWVKRCLLYVR